LLAGVLVEAQGTLSSQVLRLLGRVNTWTATQTFTNVTVTGTCTGCGTSAGTVTHTGGLTASQLILGNGTADITALGSLGTTTTVLHGNAAGAPTFGAVDLAADVTGNLGVTHLGSGTNAGATTFLRGDMTWVAPAGSGTVTTTGSPVSGNLAVFSGASSITGSALGTGVQTALGVNVGSAGAPVLFNGAGGTPSSLTLTSATGLPLTTGVTGVLPAANVRGVVQVVNTQTGAVATGTTTIPLDDTIPQNTEGTEFMTLAITPTSATNKLKIETVFYFSYSVPSSVIVALFQDANADAVAVTSTFIDTGTASETVTFTHYMTAGTTSATTFKVRAGGNSAGTVSFNGQSGARRFGGAAASSITITEITP
jgi:hypothetical protein